MPGRRNLCLGRRLREALPPRMRRRAGIRMQQKQGRSSDGNRCLGGYGLDPCRAPSPALLTSCAHRRPIARFSTQIIASQCWLHPVFVIVQILAAAFANKTLRERLGVPTDEIQAPVSGTDERRPAPEHKDSMPAMSLIPSHTAAIRTASSSAGTGAAAQQRRRHKPA